MEETKKKSSLCVIFPFFFFFFCSREAEERFEQAQQETADAFQDKQCLQELVADLTTELTEMKQLRKRFVTYIYTCLHPPISFYI